MHHTVFFLLYSMLTKQIFEAFNCQYVGRGMYLLASDTSIECYTNEHALIMVVAVIFMLLYTLGLPVLSIIVLLRLRARIKMEADMKAEPVVIRLLGFVYDGYEPSYLWWESVVMLRKASIAAVIVFFRNDAYMQVLFAAFVAA